MKSLKKESEALSPKNYLLENELSQKAKSWEVEKKQLKFTRWEHEKVLGLNEEFKEKIKRQERLIKEKMLRDRTNSQAKSPDYEGKVDTRKNGSSEDSAVLKISNETWT